ncbi:MAG: hypothetical protein ACRCTZ_23425 [Sarcina sp.]
MRREDLLKKFLGCHNINLIDRELIRKKYKLENTIESLSVFHKNLKGKRDYSMGLTSEAGRIRLEQKISLIRMERFQKESDLCLKEVIEYAKECVSEVEENKFISLIDRSYKNSEIILGKVYQNICGNNITLDVSDTSRIRFGMIEDDFIKFIRRVERRDKQLNYLEMTNEFVNLEGLDEVSKVYIKSTIEYPSEIANYISFAYVRDFDDEKVKEGLTNIKSNFKFF